MLEIIGRIARNGHLTIPSKIRKKNVTGTVGTKLTITKKPKTIQTVFHKY